MADLSITALLNAFRKKREPTPEEIDQNAAQAKQGAQQVANQLPSAVVPRDALRRQKSKLQQLEDIDRAGRE